MNDQFDYAMAPVAIVIGLALAHILGALGVALHRLRGHGRPIRLEAVYLLWVGFMLVWLVSFWWWEYKFHEIGTTWTFGLYLFVIGYALLLYLMAVVLVPRGMKELDDSYAYFMSGRRWFFAGLLVASAVDLVDTSLKGRDWIMRADYVASVAVSVTGAIVGMVATQRRVQLAVAVVFVAIQVVYTWIALLVLGQF